MTKEKVAAVNKILLDGEPGNITKPDTNGYVGYAPQDIIDAMNEVFWGEWGFEELSNETVDNEKGTLAIAQVKVWIAGCDFQPTSWGQSRVTRGDTGDAKKGAQTDAMKKGLSLLSIGNRAYHGLLDAKAKPTVRNQAPQTKPVLASPPKGQTSALLRMIEQAQKRVEKLGLVWEEVKQQALSETILDDQLEMKHFAFINSRITDLERQGQAVGAGK